MTDLAPTPAPAAGAAPIQSAVLDMSRSVLMAAGTPLLARGLVTGSQEQAIIGGLLALASAVWSYLAAHPSKAGPLASLLGVVKAGGQTGAWNADLARLEALLLPIVEKQVDAQIKAKAGIFAGPVDLAANAAIKTGADQLEGHLKIV